jgi:hypothetical protein
MGFSGGGSNILKPHTHDSTVVQDGGNLDFKNVTQGDMSAGSLTQSDGVHLQELLIGNPAEIPRVNGAGTAVEWHSPTDLTGSMELLGSNTLVAAAANLELTGTWTAADYTYFIIVLGASNDNSGGTPSLEMRLNNSSLANYHTNMVLNTAGVLSATTSGAVTSGLICTTNVIPPSSTETCQTQIQLQLSEQSPSNTFRWTWSNSSMWAQAGAIPSDTEQIAGLFGNNFQTQLIKLDFFFSDASNFRIGSNVFLYGVKRT